MVERTPDIDPEVYGAVACDPAAPLEHEGLSRAAVDWLVKASRVDGAIAAKLLAVPDEHALDDALDDLVDSGEVIRATRARWRAVREVQQAAGYAPLPQTVPLEGALAPERLRELLGGDAAELLEHTLKLALGAAHVRRAFMQAAGHDDAGPNAHTDHAAWEPEWKPESLLDLVPAWRTAMFRSLRGVPSGIALMVAIEEGRRIEPALAVALAERWFEGEEASLRMLFAWGGLHSDDPLPTEMLARAGDPSLTESFEATSRGSVAP